MKSLTCDLLSLKLNSFCETRGLEEEWPDLNVDCSFHSKDVGFSSILEDLKVYLRDDSTSNESKILNIIQGLQPSLTNENEDWVRVNACKILQSIIRIYYPKGYALTSTTLDGSLCASLQGILRFLLARLDDLVCTEAVVDCIFTLLVLQDSIVADRQRHLQQTEIPNRRDCSTKSCSIPLPVQIQHDEKRIDEKDEVGSPEFDISCEEITFYPQGNQVDQYRWLTIKDVSHVLSSICSKVQLEYLRSKHRRQVFDIFLKYLLCDYRAESLTFDDRHVLQDCSLERETYLNRLCRSLISTDFLENFIRCFDNERDPHNVHSFFKICLQLTEISDLGSSMQTLVRNEDFFHSFACFFPLMYEEGLKKGVCFQPYPAEGKSRLFKFSPTSEISKDLTADSEGIKYTLHGLLSCKTFSTFSIPFMITKLESSAIDEAQDILDVFQRIFEKCTPSHTKQESKHTNNLLIANIHIIRKRTQYLLRSMLLSDTSLVNSFSLETLQATFAGDLSDASLKLRILKSSKDRCAPKVVSSIEKFMIVYHRSVSQTVDEACSHVSSENSARPKISGLVIAFSRWLANLAEGESDTARAIQNEIKDICCETIQSLPTGFCEGSPASQLHGYMVDSLVNFALLFGNGSCRMEHIQSSLLFFCTLIRSRKQEVSMNAQSQNGEIAAASRVHISAHEPITFVETYFLQILRAFLQEITEKVDNIEIQWKLIDLVNAIYIDETLTSEKWEKLRPEAKVIYLNFFGESAKFCERVLVITQNSNAAEAKPIYERYKSHLSTVLYKFLKFYEFNHQTNDRPLDQFLLHHLAQLEGHGLEVLIKCISQESLCLCDNPIRINSDVIFVLFVQVLRSKELLERYCEVITKGFRFLLRQSISSTDANRSLGIAAAIMLEIPVEAAQKLELTPLFVDFLSTCLHNQDKDLGSGVFENIFRIITLAHTKGLVDEIFLLKAIESVDTSKSSAFEAFKKVIHMGLSLSRMEKETLEAEILNCYKMVSIHSPCADICKYLPHIAAKFFPHIQWDLIVDGYVDTAREFTIQNEDRIDEVRIFSALSNAFYTIQLAFHAGERKEGIDEMLDRVFTYLSQRKSRGMVWKVIDLIDFEPAESFLGQKIPHMEDSSRYKSAVFTRAGVLLEKSTALYPMNKDSLEIARLQIAFMLLSSLDYSEAICLPSCITYMKDFVIQAVSSYVEYHNSILACLGVIFLNLKKNKLTLTPHEAIDLLQIALVPLLQELYMRSSSPLVSLSLDILLGLYDKVPLKSSLGVDEDSKTRKLRDLILSSSFLSHGACIHDIVFVLAKSPLDNSQRYVRRRAQMCRHMYSSIES